MWLIIIKLTNNIQVTIFGHGNTLGIPGARLPEFSDKARAADIAQVFAGFGVERDDAGFLAAAQFIARRRQFFFWFE